MRNRVMELREEKRMSQVHLSIELDVTQETVSAYERGKHHPSIKSLLIMSKLFNASIDYILGVSDIRYPLKENQLPLNETAILLLLNLNDSQKETVIAFMRGMLE